MPEASQYTFANKELLELLIKQAGVHEGRWLLMAMLSFAPGNFGPTNEDSAPGAAVIVTRMGIQKAAPETPLEMTLDAAVVNPAPSSTEKRQPSERSRRAGSSKGSPP